MANRITSYNTFASLTTASTVNLDQNFTYTASGFEDSSLGWNNLVTVDSGSANNYVVTLPYGAPSNYNVGFLVEFIPANSNTGASNITISPLGSATIVDSFGNMLFAGAIVAGKLCQIVYTGTNFRLLNAYQTGGVPYYYDWDDFISGGAALGSGPSTLTTKLLASWGTGSGSNPYGTVVAGHPGIWQLTAGSGTYSILAVPAATDGGLGGQGGGCALDGSTNLMLRSILQPNVLGTNVDFTFGLWSLHAVGLATGTHVFAGFVGNLNRNADWLAYANSSSSSVTSNSTGVAMTAGTWYTLEFTYTASTGTLTFFVNGAQVTTINTNLPSSTTILYPGFQVLSNSGSSTYLMDTYEISANPGVASRFLYGPI